MLIRQDDLPRATFDQLALPLLDPLYNFARWMTHNREEAEDLVQETYLKALRSFKSFQNDTNFRAWIFRILKNTFLSSRTSMAARMTVSLDPEEDKPIEATIEETPESILISCSDVDLVRSALEELPGPFREVILLCDLEEMSYREIAEALSIPIGTVMSRLARARKALRTQLAKAASVPASRGSCAME